MYFRYPFCVVTCYGIGIAFPRLSAVIAVTMVLSGGYALSAIAIHHDPGWNVMPKRGHLLRQRRRRMGRGAGATQGRVFG